MMNFINFVKKGKEHCSEGMFSTCTFSVAFRKALKGRIQCLSHPTVDQPFPLLFFFDYGDFKIFGSSPEAQLIVQKVKAEIHPIAGTFKRTGEDEKMH